MKRLMLVMLLVILGFINNTTSHTQSYDTFLERYVSFYNEAKWGYLTDVDVAAGVTVPTNISNYYYDEFGIYFTGVGTSGTGRFFSGNAPLENNNTYAAYIKAKRMNTQTNQNLYFGLRPDNIQTIPLTLGMTLYGHVDDYFTPNNWWGFAADNGLQVHIQSIHIFDLDKMYNLGLISEPTQLALEAGGYQYNFNSPAIHGNNVPLNIHFRSWVDYMEINVKIYRIDEFNTRLNLLRDTTFSPSYNVNNTVYDYTFIHNFGVGVDTHYEVVIDGESYYFEVINVIPVAEEIPIIIFAVIALLIFMLYIGWVKKIPVVNLLAVPLVIFLAYEFRMYLPLLITFIGLLLVQLLFFYQGAMK